MDVRLSSEQRALQDSAAQVVDRLGVRAVGQLHDAERTARLDAAVAAAGWRELRVADVGDAPLASGVEAAIVAEELGRGLADTPFIGPTLAAELRRRAGAPPAEGPETVLLTTDLADLAEGPAASLVLDAGGVQGALLLRPGAEGPTLGRVEVLQADVRTDLTRPVGEVDPAAGVTPLGADARPLTHDDLAAWTALGLALTCADLVGTMRGALDLTSRYAQDRRQYGRPVASFQAVQHLLAEALVALEGSRSVARHAAWAVDSLAPAEALAAAALAKAYCARAARTVCETAIQVHGGIGNTWDCLAHVHLRRALLSTDLLGGTAACLQHVLEARGIGGGRGLR